MHDRSYGTSGYSPSRIHERNRGDSASFRKQKSLIKKILYSLAALLALLVFFLWLFLGDFRFLLWRYPSLSGFPFGSRTYLVLFQNNYELRPTGGFISSYGALTFQSGLYTGMEFFDVYGEVDDHDFVEPPLVLSALLSGEGYQGHTFRDANFDPDFRLTKDELIKFYQMTNPEARVDGVIAVDFSFLEDLVGLYEPLEVEGYELTEANLFETLSSVVSDIDRHNEEALASRKDIAAPLVEKIIFKSIILPWRLLTLRDILAQGFEEKHVLAAFNRSGLQNSFNKRGWDGALPQSDLGDFLAINEGNYGGMKSDRYITRDVQYELEVTSQTDVLGNPVVKANVTVTLSHEGGWNIPLSGPYTGYLRTMIPIGSNVELGAAVSEDREDVFVLGEMVELEPGQSVTYNYSYELPEYIWSDGVYYLHLNKQPGTDEDHYRIIVKLPQGMTLSSDSLDVRENIAFYDTKLLTDTNLSFSIMEDETPPRIVMHEITALNEITIVFNEPLNVDHASDPLNFDVLDTNYENVDSTDELRIVNLRVDGAALILTTEGMTEQIEERYEVVLRGLTDTNGNIIDPNPRTITVVQRNLLGEKVEETLEIDDNTANE